MRPILKTSLALLALTGLLTTSHPAMANKQVTLKDAQLIIEDNAGLFSADARSKAKTEFAKLKSEYDRQVTIYTVKELAAKDLADHDQAKKDGTESKFWSTYTHNLAKEDRAKGVFILICRHPGEVYIIADKLMQDAGVDAAKEKEVREKFITSFRAAKEKPEAEAQSLRDAALISVASYLHDNVSAAKANNIRSTTTTNEAKHEGLPIWGWVCIGLAVVGVLWMIIGLVRGGSVGGGGVGGGGGGGGFFTGLLGGMFGAMAGMWMYNNLFGGHSFGDSGNSGGDNGGGDTGETGGGDFSGDSGTGGGWDDGGGGGGGDFGGGGGDFGGGGGDF